MKSFKQFRNDASLSTYRLSLTEDKKKKKSDLKIRMSNAYKKNKRQKKIDKLMRLSSHWRNLS